MKKNSNKQESLILYETTQDSFEQVTDGNIYDFNQQWKNYWHKHFAEEFKEHAMFKAILSMKKEIKFLNESISKIVKINEQFFNENVELGKLIENLKHKLKSKELENIDLRKKIGKKPNGFFDTTTKLINKNVRINRLLEENEKLKETQNQMTTISTDTVEQILILRIKGLNYDEIAEKTGVSKSSVGRYIQKNKKRLEELEIAMQSTKD